MYKLEIPSYSLLETLNRCIDGITGQQAHTLSLKAALSGSLSELETLGNLYNIRAVGNELNLFTPLPINAALDTTVIGTINKRQFKSIYSNYFVNQEKPAREIYDNIKLLANGKCPYCGGIGRTRELDHYLPQAHFPQFSVHPTNLIPACRDCNQGEKGATYLNDANRLILHPYFDDTKYFEEQWIFSTLIIEEIAQLRFNTEFPTGWTENERSRAQNHFNAFNLGEKYEIVAMEGLEADLRAISKLTTIGFTPIEVVELLIQPYIEDVPFVNHWRRGKYQALANHLLSS